MNRALLMLAAAALVACDGGETYESSGTVVDTVRDTTRRMTIPDIDVGVTTDTVTVPVFSTEKDTIIVDKPVVAGQKKVEVKRPTVDVNRKP